MTKNVFKNYDTYRSLSIYLLIVVLLQLVLYEKTSAQNIKIDQYSFVQIANASINQNFQLSSYINSNLEIKASDGSIQLSYYYPEFLNLTTSIEDQIILDVPSSFTISQNYPNPFNPSTNIHVAIPTESSIKIQIFSLTGELVSTIFNDKHAPGNYFFNWDGKSDYGFSVPSGVYFCRINNSNEIKSIKMLLLK